MQKNLTQNVWVEIGEKSGLIQNKSEMSKTNLSGGVNPEAATKPVMQIIAG